MAKNYTSDWMAASLTSVSLPSNRQTKVPGLGMDQMTAKQSIMDGAPNDQAQDDPGFASVGPSCFGENVPGKVMSARCAKPAQSAGSAASMVPFNGGTAINLGAPGWSGTKAAAHTTMPDNEWGSGRDPLSNITTSSRKSVAGNSTPEGKILTGENRDMGTSNGMLFPGIIE